MKDLIDLNKKSIFRFLRHRALRELLDHLLGVHRLAERDHVPGVPHYQDVEVVGLGEISNNIH